MYQKLSKTQTELNNLREKGYVRGESIGWEWDKLPITLKKGCTTYIAASPTAGKTEFWLEVLINLSCTKGWKHIIFTPETGDTSEVYAELMHKYTGKPFIKGQGAMTQGERISAEMFIDEHFVVVDPIEKDLTILQFYDLVDEIERDLEMDFQTTLIDPWNELTEEYHAEDLGREDKYLSRILGQVRKNARKTGRHNCVINHVRDQRMINVDDISYFPMPHPREFAGGQSWFRKGLLMIILWRPPEGLSGNDNVAYERNELHVKVAKAKPKGVAKVGTYKMYLDTFSYQYYMINTKTGGKMYAQRGVEEAKQTELIK